MHSSPYLVACGMAPKEVSVKTLANIIQARMSEIMDFVTYHLKQVGLDNKVLNGGIILTGGGSQLKHLIQLTEYVTGLNAPSVTNSERTPPADISKNWPNQCTALVSGLIMKGYNDYENKSRAFEENFW